MDLTSSFLIKNPSVDIIDLKEKQTTTTTVKGNLFLLIF
jgi:hypothetical protein